MSAIKEIVRVACGVSIVMVAWALIALVEVVYAGRLGSASLAGVSISTAIVNLVFIVSLGFVVSLTPIISEMVGARDDRTAIVIANNGVYFAIGLGVLAIFCLLAAWCVSPYVAVSEDVSQSMRDYLAPAMWALPAWLVYVALRSIAISCGSVSVITFAMVTSVPIHLATAYALAFGINGVIAPMGVFGLGAAFSFVSYVTVGLIILGLRRSHNTILSAVLVKHREVNLSALHRLMRLGLPMSCRITLREALIPLSILLLSYQAEAEIVAHSVAVRIVALAGMIGFGVSNGVIATVGSAYGRGLRSLSPQISGVGVVVALVFTTPVAIGIFFGRDLVPRVLVEGLPSEAAVIAAHLLILASIYIVLDAVQSAVSGGLVGIQDTSGALLCYVIGTWCLGVPAALILMNINDNPSAGLWLGLIIGGVITSVLMCARLGRLTNSCDGYQRAL